MSGDVPLREHFEALLAEHDKRSTARFEAQERAIAVAEQNAEKWRMNANEWREAMNDRERNFLSRGMGYVIGAVSIIAMIANIVSRLA